MRFATIFASVVILCIGILDADGGNSIPEEPGKESFSGNNTLECEIAEYPNPIIDGAVFELDVTLNVEKENIIIMMIDVFGRESVSTLTIDPTDQGVIVSLANKHLPSGTYYIMGTTNNQLHAKKIVIP
ncbi:MAG: T9SS type A sorting domain-containing protein [Bacteroidetes bacterium]|nr:T9SS type A sorting domain-containing protein [Bacteroidota bacterium]